MFQCPQWYATVTTGGGTLEIYSNKQDNKLCITGTYADPESDLVTQTAKIMSGINQSLFNTNATFENVVKATAHYLGGATENELHENMNTTRILRKRWTYLYWSSYRGAIWARLKETISSQS